MFREALRKIMGSFFLRAAAQELEAACLYVLGLRLRPAAPRKGRHHRLIHLSLHRMFPAAAVVPAALLPTVTTYRSPEIGSEPLSL